MPVTLSFGNRHGYEVNHSRIARLMSSDKQEALYMGVWDRFKDHFRTQKKQEVLEVLHTLIHGCERENQAELNVDTVGMEKIHAFAQLKQYADPSQQDRFVMRFDLSQTQILFEIDGKVIEKCNLHRLLNVSENCIFKVMEEDEEELFFKICIKYGEKIARYPELLQNFAFKLRQEVNEDDEIKDEVYKLMRSGEDRKMACVEWNGTLTEGEIDKLLCLQMGSFSIATQFFKIGYWELEGEVMFDMFHPTLIYLLQGYTPSLSCDFTEANTMLLSDVLKKDDDDYHNNKREIDSILRKIYRSHNNTLFISKNSGCRNMLL
ncbi:TPA: type III secretion system effector SopD2 [Salmonella enterica subsp. salamae serovar 21:z10:[z6]]|uniref:Type III secretion system effector SopD2 n=4 Tax=Salmonella enterica subsp. salamae TaxID=59202 RepID=A0A5Y1WIW9_SALER|nr:type III secretion system effector SopD2 [Salmonella enterica]EAA4437615.1 type III secretion system effector SopD2 [Salmonella enterica subsp. salamae]ECG1422170.1 type III secretion system effector SopD2 [Salmonella enterica subsp. salamae str. CFSAN000559]MBA2991346.1 type III secretion system effector SopD2 [Salmonella enterica subsp. salamae serovar 47:z:e,n,x,z15]HAC6414272.1 type III secretion system effector SopD2 [Salmonella enterica subsp. salamae serovar 58:a:-]HAE4724302.1 type 